MPHSSSNLIPALSFLAFFFFHLSLRCSHPQLLVYQINRITFPLGMSFFVVFLSVGSYSGCSPWDSLGNCKCRRPAGGFWCFTCDINYKGCVWNWVSDDKRSGYSHSSYSVKASCNFHVSLQVSEHQSFKKTLFIFNIPSFNRRNPLYKITKISAAWDKGCSATLNFLSFHFQGCGKRQQSECYPFQRAHKFFSGIHSIIHSMVPINLKCLII